MGKKRTVRVDNRLSTLEISTPKQTIPTEVDIVYILANALGFGTRYLALEAIPAASFGASLFLITLTA